MFVLLPFISPCCSDAIPGKIKLHATLLNQTVSDRQVLELIGSHGGFHAEITLRDTGEVVALLSREFWNRKELMKNKKTVCLALHSRGGHWLTASTFARSRRASTCPSSLRCASHGTSARLTMRAQGQGSFVGWY